MLGCMHSEKDKVVPTNYGGPFYDVLIPGNKISFHKNLWGNQAPSRAVIFVWTTALGEILTEKTGDETRFGG